MDIKQSLHEHTFMISSGLNVPRPAIPIPDFAVPNAAPTAAYHITRKLCILVFDDYAVSEKIARDTHC